MRASLFWLLLLILAAVASPAMASPACAPAVLETSVSVAPEAWRAPLPLSTAGATLGVEVRQ